MADLEANTTGGTDRTGPTLCIAAVLTSSQEVAVVEEMDAHGLLGTFFVAPEALVEMSGAFAAGHELGNGALADATLNGELGRWTQANLDAELTDADELLKELGFGIPNSILLPGERHTTAEGTYRRKLQLRYPITVSPVAAGCSLFGARKKIHPIALGHTNIDDLAPLLSTTPEDPDAIYVLLMPGDDVLRKLRTSVLGLIASRQESWRVKPPSRTPESFAGILSLVRRTPLIAYAWGVLVFLACTVGGYVILGLIIPHHAGGNRTFIHQEDPQLQNAIETARRSLPEFEKAFSSPGPDIKSVALKVRLTGDASKAGVVKPPATATVAKAGPSEYIWVDHLEALSGGNYSGQLADAPLLVTGLKKGDKVTVKAEDIVDWIILYTSGRHDGAFTDDVLQKRQGS